MENLFIYFSYYFPLIGLQTFTFNIFHAMNLTYVAIASHGYKQNTRIRPC